MRLEHDQSTHPRLLRKPALGEVSATTRITAEKKPKKPKGSRFVGATHLDDDQKVLICKALKKGKIGDEIGRQIFIGALEYQISRVLCDARILNIFEGAGEIQAQVIARRLLEKGN